MESAIARARVRSSAAPPVASGPRPLPPAARRRPWTKKSPVLLMRLVGCSPETTTKISLIRTEPKWILNGKHDPSVLCSARTLSRLHGHVPSFCPALSRVSSCSSWFRFDGFLVHDSWHSSAWLREGQKRVCGLRVALHHLPAIRPVQVGRATEKWAASERLKRRRR